MHAIVDSQARMVTALEPGDGTNRHQLLMSRANTLVSALESPMKFREAICDVLRQLLGRPESHSTEVSDTVDNALSPTGVRTTHQRRESKWPKFDAQAFQKVMEAYEPFSPTTPDIRDSRVLVSRMFGGRGDTLVCLGKQRESAQVYSLQELGAMDPKEAQLHCFLVPNPAGAREGATKSGKASPRGHTNFPRRRFIVLEFDEVELPEGKRALQEHEQLRLIQYVKATYGLCPVTIVSSGGKSLHSYYYCEGVSEPVLRRWMEDLVRLGACQSQYCPSYNQFARTPAARRFKEGVPFRDRPFQEVLHWDEGGLVESPNWAVSPRRGVRELELGFEERKPKGPRPLPDETLPQAPSATPAMLPEPVRAFAEDVVDRGSFHFDYVATSLLVALGSVLGSKCAVFPKERDDWHEFPNLWSLMVGRPGMMKSPALSSAMRPLRTLDYEASQDFDTEMEAYQKAKQVFDLHRKAAISNAQKAAKNGEQFDCSYGVEPPTPYRRRYFTTDATTAALGVLFQQNPRGILLECDELASVLKSFDRDPELRSLMLTAWNGGSPLMVDRIGRGLANFIERCCLSVIGCTQPGRILPFVRQTLHGGPDDDGFLQRFQLVSFPEGFRDPWKNVDRWPDSTAKKLAHGAFDSLDKLVMTLYPDDKHPGLRFDAESRERFVAWRHILEKRCRSGEEAEAMESALNKQRTLVPAIALISQLTCDPEAGSVEIEHVERAVQWADWSEGNIRRLFAMVTSDDIGVGRRILRKILEGKLKTPFSARDVYRPGWARLTDKSAVEDGIELLCLHAWLTAVEVVTGGRPTCHYYLAEGVTNAAMSREVERESREIAAA